MYLLTVTFVKHAFIHGIMMILCMWMHWWILYYTVLQNMLLLLQLYNHNKTSSGLYMEFWFFFEFTFFTLDLLYVLITALRFNKLIFALTHFIAQEVVCSHLFKVYLWCILSELLLMSFSLEFVQIRSPLFDEIGKQGKWC